MNRILEFMYDLKFDTESIGIQKNLLLAALLGTISNLPKEIKSNFKQAVMIVTGTLLSTILTPLVMNAIEGFTHSTLPPESGYGISALLGIIGTNNIKKLIIKKLGKDE